MDEIVPSVRRDVVASVAAFRDGTDSPVAAVEEALARIDALEPLLNAFVVRRPDENHESFYRWLLERNLRLYGVTYAIDRLGDVYLSGRLPLAAVTPEEVDRLLGSVLENSDGSFNVLLELGFASSIRKEYAWRVSRGESTRNLAAFTHLTGEDD